MPCSRMLAFPTALAIPLAALLSHPALATGSERSAAPELCVRAAEYAALKTGVPLQLLLALTLTETGRSKNGALQPWPWALNQGGEGHWFATKDEALAFLSDAVDKGVGNIDVGCFQLNYRWHGAAFASLDKMMDPRANALYAARLVARHAAEQGDWVAAAGAYHSATPDKAETYLARFGPIYAGLGPGSPDAPPGGPPDEAPDKPRVNRFPLLMAGQSASSGSLVPKVAAGASLFGGP